MEELIWLTEEAFSGLIYYWPVTVVLVILSIAALLTAIIRKERSLFKNIFIALLPFVGTVLILLSGRIFKQNRTFGFAPIIGVLLVISLAIYAIYRTKSLWYLSLPISALVLWASFFAWLVSAMSIADDWM